MSTSQSWSLECQYISNMNEVFRGNRHPDATHKTSDFNGDRKVFLNYCRMQSRAAERAGRHDSVVYIEHCIDDMEDLDLELSGEEAEAMHNEGDYV